MKTLLILRHAHASPAAQGIDDHERPLADSGRQAAERVGRFLYEQGLTPDLVVSSTAVRAYSTAEIAAAASRYEGEIQSTRRLYLADPGSCIQVLRTLSDDHRRLLLIGHNPGVEELIRLLTGSGESLLPAALARVLVPIPSWDDLDEDTLGKLVRVWGPSEVG